MRDFSDPETKALYEREVRRRVEEFGMAPEQAQMLVAVLMAEERKLGEDCSDD